MPQRPKAAPRRGRPPLDHAARKAAIIRAAAQAFVHAGIERASMDEVAAKLGLAKLSIYRLFETKARVVEAALAEAAGEMERALSCWPDPREVTARALAFARREPDLFQLLLRVTRGHPEYGATYAAIEDLSARQLAVLVHRPEKGKTPAVVMRASYAMATLLHDAMARHAAEAKPAQDEAFLDWCAATIAAWAKATTEWSRRA